MNLKEIFDFIKKNVSELGTGTPTSAKFLSGTGVWTTAATLATITPATPSRTFGVNYQNTTTTPKFITIHMLLQFDAAVTLDGVNSATVYCDATATPTTNVSALALELAGVTGTQIKEWGNLFFIVPPNYYYRVDDYRSLDASATTISTWFEYALSLT